MDDASTGERYYGEFGSPYVNHIAQLLLQTFTRLFDLVKNKIERRNIWRQYQRLFVSTNF